MGRYVNGRWHEELPNLTDSGGSVGGDPSPDPTNPGISSGGGGGGAPGQSSGGGGGGGNYDDILNAFRNSSGFSIQDLAERKRQFDQQLEWTKQMWANQGLPDLQIRQQAAQLAREEFEQQKAMAHANLGLDYLKTSASLGGPSDYFQQSNFLRGASANPELPTFLNALRTNTGLSAFNAPLGALPAVQSMGMLAAGLTGGAPNPVGALKAIGNIGAAGAGALGPQALEQLNPDELALFGSGMRASGYSMPSFLESYRQSRVGQGAGQAG